MDDQTRLQSLRFKHGSGREVEPHEYYELLTLEAQEFMERQDSIESADSEFSAIGGR